MYSLGFHIYKILLSAQNLHKMVYFLLSNLAPRASITIPVRFYLYLLFLFLYCLCLTQFLFHSQHFLLMWKAALTPELAHSGPPSLYHSPLHFTTAPCTHLFLDRAKLLLWPAIPQLPGIFIILRSCHFPAPSHTDSSNTTVLWPVNGLFPLLIFILRSVVFLYSLVLL